MIKLRNLSIKDWKLDNFISKLKEGFFQKFVVEEHACH